MGILDIFRSKPPSPEKFAKLYADFLARNGYTQPLRFVAEAFQFRLGDGNSVLDLHNVYRDYCAAAKSERDNVLAKYAHILSAPGLPDTFAAARSRLLPSIRGKAYLAMMTRMARANGNANTEEPYRALSGDAVVTLAFDGEHTIQNVQASTLEKWGVSFDGAYQAALDNLRDISVAKFEQFAPGVYVSAWNDSYDSARMLLPDVIHQLGLGAAPVFMVPTRNRLIVASGANRTAIGQLIDLAHHVVQEEGRAVSSRLYRLAGREPVEFVPDDAELADNLKLLELKFLSEDYAAQKAELEKQHAKEGSDIFVASFAAYKIGGRPMSISTLTQGVDTLLPKSDAVALVTMTEQGTDTSYKIVRWEDVWAALGDAMTLQDEYPALYRVNGFPREDVLQRMAALPT